MMNETPTSGVSARDDDDLRSPAIKLFKQVTPRQLGIKCPQSLRNRVQSTCLDDAAHLTTYVRLWVLVEVMLLFHDPWLIPRAGFAKFVYGVHGATLRERTWRTELPDPCRGRVFLEGLCGRRTGPTTATKRMACQDPYFFSLAGSRGSRRAALH